MLVEFQGIQCYWICLFLLMFYGCPSNPPEVESVNSLPAVSEKVIDLVGGNEVVDVIMNAETVQGYLLPPKSFHEKSLDDYSMRLGPIDLTEAQIDMLREVVLAEESYLYDLAKGCEPDYGVRIEFVLGERRVDLFFCFGCTQLQVYQGGKSLSGGLFDPVEEKLITIMQGIFTGDQLIQSL